MTLFRPLTLILLVLALPAFAVIETYEFSNPELEKRYHKLSQELRCPKCQNQNIADSNAPISEDLRALLYQQLEAGASDEEIAEMVLTIHQHLGMLADFLNGLFPDTASRTRH